MTNKLSYILFLFATVFSYGQVTLAVATEDSDLKVNQKFTVTFVLEISGDEYIQETPLKLPDLSKFNIIGTASNRNTYVDPKKNIVINQLVYQVVLEPKEAGKARIGSALVQVSGKMYKTEPSDFYIKDSDKRTNSTDELASNDIYLNMEVEDKTVYTNQPTIAVLRAYSKDFDNFRKVGNIQLPNQNNANIRTVSYKKSDIEPASRGEMASQVIAVFMIFPTESGKVEIKPASAKLKNKDLKISSNKINLNVKKLPSDSPENFKNAVGDFSVELEKNSEEQAEVNKPIDVVMKIKGNGNFVNLKLPQILESDQYRFYAPKISNHYVSGNDGMKGEISAHYIIIPNKPGKITIETEPFAYFNPDEKKYIELAPKILNLNILSKEQISEAKSTIEKVNDYTNVILETVNTPVIKTRVLQVKDKSRLNWKTIFLNIGLFSGLAVLLFLYKKQRKKRKLITRKNAVSTPVETVAETEEKLRAQHRFSLKEDLQYLEKMKNEKDSRKFFSAYDDMVKGFENQINTKYGENLNSYIEKNYGHQPAENFRILSKKISIEKYSPIFSDESLEELYSEIRQLFSEIEE